jgi:hypothetical protein
MALCVARTFLPDKNRGDKTTCTMQSTAFFGERFFLFLNNPKAQLKNISFFFEELKTFRH